VTGDTSATLLFTDIEGSTRLLTDLGESTYAELLSVHHGIIRDALRARAGVETETEGDSFFVIFDDATAALGAAVDAQRALDATEWPGRVRVRVRMGLHTGPVARSAGNVVGLAIHTAARVMAAAHGGQIVISDECARAVGTDSPFTLRDLGRFRLRDIEGPIRLLQVDYEDALEFPPLRSLPFELSPLPAYFTDLVGREEEIDAVGAVLTEQRLVSITGPPGVGKTRVAVEVARRHGEAGYVDLAPLDDGEYVPSRVATALAISVRANETATEALLRDLEDARSLAVLDNCERVLDDVAALLAELMPRCRDLRVLVTSREPLAIAGEVVWPLEPLVEASTLFVRRARAAQPALELLATDAAVTTIVDQVDRLPLAVELAASLVRTMSPDEIVRHLGDRFDLLQGYRRDLPERHRTLAAAIDWSYQLLGPEEQRCLARLAVLRGSFDLEAAVRIGSASISVITRLCDRSLVVSTGTNGTTRYRLLDTIRDYAIRELDRIGERDDAEAAHAHLFAQRAADVGVLAERVSHLAAMDADRDNYEAALAWLGGHDPDAALSLALDLEGLLTSRLESAASASLLESLLERSAGASAGTRGAALAILADVYRNSGRVGDARRAAEDSVALGTSRQLNARVSPVVVLGQIIAMQGDLGRARDLFEENLAAARAAGDAVEEMVTLRELANVAIERNEPADALPLLDAAAQLVSTGAEGPWLGGMLDRDRARAQVDLGQLREARAGFEESLALTQRYGIMRGVAANTLALAKVARLEDRLDETTPLVDEATRIYRSCGDTGGLAHALVERALIESARARHDRAVELLGAAEALRDELGIATPGSERQGITAARAAALASLGEEEVVRLTAAGRGADLDRLLT
jgi:predicted ATPase/class 3 adenylate cyclase